MRFLAALLLSFAALFALAMPVSAQWIGPEDVVVHSRADGPINPHRAAAEAAYGAETDAARRAALAANLRRWRDMPGRLGERHIFVNVPAQEVELWDGGRVVGRWPAIVGRTQTPTDSFSTTVTGVNLNPWWNIPTSIVNSRIAALVRNSPAEARRRGYVVQNGVYRQRPGPSNALGRMKLVMPNQYAIYLHDTPQQHLFDRDQRTFSAGCIRVQDAMGFAAALLGMSRSEVEAAAATGRTHTLRLAEPIPVHIAYFTAVEGEAGETEMLRDFYGRDRL